MPLFGGLIFFSCIVLRVRGCVHFGRKARGTAAMNRALSYLYRSGFWIKRDAGLAVAKMMQTFLRGYQWCAHHALVAGRNRFSIMPKLHYLAHTALEMRRQAEKADWCQNPLAASVQCQEDFIGRPARLSRRVNVKQVHRNVIHRALVSANLALKRADADQRGWDAYQ